MDRAQRRVTRRGAWLTLVLAGALGLTVGAHATAQATPSATPPDTGHTASAAAATAGQGLPAPGTYAYTLVPDSSANIKAAIDKTVAHMSFITRPIARGRLNKVNPTPHHMAVRLATYTASVSFDNGNPVVTPLDGATVPWDNALAHETDHAHAAVAGDTLRQTIAAPDGERENAMVFADGGSRLRLRVTITSHRLPQPLVYELLFKRDSTPPS